MTACMSCGAPLELPRPDQQQCADCEARARGPEFAGAGAAPRKIGDYTLQHELGSGRYAVSWLAEPPGGGGVILKLLRAYAPDPETVQRFLDEAKRLGSDEALAHPALARVLDAGVHLGGSLFLVYESGGEGTLADELRDRGRIVAPRALELCAQLAEGVQALHAAGYSHFDLKPANVGLTRDDQGVEQAVLLDAATGHLLLHAGLRETGMLPVSTAAYLAPELAAGAEAGERADLYAIGVLVYQLLSGRLPVTGHSADELIDSHRAQRPLRLRDVGRRVHGELEALLQRLLAKSPGERFADGGELAAALRKVAPIADQATDDHGDDEIEDPLPVTVAAPPEPEIAPPPTVRAESPPLPRPAIPRAHQRTSAHRIGRKRWLSAQRAILGTAGLFAASAIVFALWPDPPPPPHKHHAPALPQAEASDDAPNAAGGPSRPSDPPAPAAVPPPETLRAAPGAVEPLAAPPAPAPRIASLPHAATTRAPSAAAEAPPSAAALLAQARRQLARHQVEPAKRSLASALERPDLADAERTRATRLMAEAEAAGGDKRAASDWYRKYLRATDDPAERARVVRLLQALNH